MEKLFTLINNINKTSECFIILSYFSVERSFYLSGYTRGRGCLHRNA